MNVKEFPADFRVSIANADGKDAYPIASFTWLLVPATIQDPAKRKAIADLLRWMIADGQGLVGAFSYAPLPKAIVEKEREAIAKLEQASSRQ
jgi:phosphate transport system substrate-binding protein